MNKQWHTRIWRISPFHGIQNYHECFCNINIMALSCHMSAALSYLTAMKLKKSHMCLQNLRAMRLSVVDKDHLLSHHVASSSCLSVNTDSEFVPKLIMADSNVCLYHGERRRGGRRLKRNHLMRTSTIWTRRYETNMRQRSKKPKLLESLSPKRRKKGSLRRQNFPSSKQCRLG